MTDDTTREVRATLIYADDEGESHFRDLPVTVVATDFSPPTPATFVSAPVDAARFLFLRTPAGWYGEPHPVPNRQYMVLLAGAMEVTTSDGERRRFTTGDVVLVEDTTGRGHTSRVLGDDDVLMAVTQL